ncbi:MAG: polar amino acid transport system substrate-binding protein [Oleiphilaceae bacterium]|jgi:polar amino acid transport system substrate-binding protein
MKINYMIKKRFFLFSCLIILSINSAWLMAECNKVLVNGWGGEWAPFLMGTYDKPEGLDIEILDAVVKASGCGWRNTELEITWKRHLNWLRVGELDLATGASWTQERAEYAYFTKAYRSENVALFVRKSDIKKYEQYSLLELAGVLRGIGVEFGNTYGSKIGALLAKMSSKVQHVNDNKQNIPKLLGGRIDGYLGHLPYDAMLIKNKGHEGKVAYLPLSLVNTGDIHIMVSKLANSEEVFKAIDAGLAEIKANGTYDKIIKKYSDKYGLSHW